MSKGRFGVHGGQYIPETLMNAVIELEAAYDHYKSDPAFNAELNELLSEYAGRPSPPVLRQEHDRRPGRGQGLPQARGPQPYRRAQDQQRPGPGALAKKMGKTRLIAETGAGQHGVATDPLP